jgi:hypothetical protein
MSRNAYLGGHTVLTQRRGDLEATLARDKARHAAKTKSKDYNRIAAGLHDSAQQRYELEKAALTKAKAGDGGIMFKTSADKLDYINRVGSHATKAREGISLAGTRGRGEGLDHGVLPLRSVRARQG